MTSQTLITMERPAGIEAYPPLVQLIDYCASLAGDHVLPHRRDFRPSQVRWMFGHMYLIDVLDGGADYRCRLWGQFWETIFGLDVLGMRLSELERAGYVPHVRGEYDCVVATRMPQFRTGRAVWADGASIDYARVIVPFAGDDGAVSMLLTGGTSDKSLEDLVFFKGLGAPTFATDTTPAG
jgi:hypothetical protein